MQKRLDVVFHVWGYVSRWGTLASAVAGGVYGLLYALQLLLTASSIHVMEMVGVPLFGVFLGAALGIAPALLDGLILGALLASDVFHPQASSMQRWRFYAVSAVVTGSGIAFELSGILSAFAYVIPPALIAAIGGGWTAHRVLTHEPRKKKKNDGLIVAEL